MYRTHMDSLQADLVRLDHALLRLRRFLSAPRTLDDQGREIHLSTLLILDGLPHEGQSVGDIAARLDVAHSTASRLVARAETAGATTRAPAAHDARQTLVLPTSTGLEMAARASTYRLARLAEIVAPWDGDDVRDLATGLDRFARASTEGTVHATTGAEHPGS